MIVYSSYGCRFLLISLIVFLLYFLCVSSIVSAFTEEKLTALDAAASDSFGYSISIYGDIAIVGAPNVDPGGVSDAGAAYVFTRSGEVWIQQEKLTALDAAASDSFGHSVSIYGDTAIVGAPNVDPEGVSDAGAAYVFTRSGEVWIQQEKLTASDASSYDYFGYSVSIYGDIAIVGAYKANPGGVSDAGAAYVFTRSGEVWIQQKKLTALGAAASDWFGISVSLYGDTAIVGAELADYNGASTAGAAYVFTRSGEVWMQQEKPQH